jgi:hypothetical protein
VSKRFSSQKPSVCFDDRLAHLLTLSFSCHVVLCLGDYEYACQC